MKKGKRIISENSRGDSIKKAVELLKEYSVPENEIGSVEFFFYANELNSALDLMNQLKRFDYFAECKESDSGNDKFLITGSTTPISITEKKLIEWFEDMKKIANCCNCKFDGWGKIID